MSFRFVFWMIGLLVITILIEVCAILFGSADFDWEQDVPDGNEAKD